MIFQSHFVSHCIQCNNFNFNTTAIHARHVGDRYVGYDYASKKPLEDFQLQAPAGYHDPTLGTMSNAIPLVSSLPVVGILGRQHHVDAIYHDFASDLVYIFTAMKFYTFEAAEFKVSNFFCLSRK